MSGSHLTSREIFKILPWYVVVCDVELINGFVFYFNIHFLSNEFDLLDLFGILDLFDLFDILDLFDWLIFLSGR